LPLSAIGMLVLVDLGILAIVLVATLLASRAMGFAKEDEITIVFCGSKKSLASGIPMASAIFAGQNIGAVVLPLMIFHQIQLLVCAFVARRYAERPKAPRQTRAKTA
jgi:sodium/bile acid cotransporter 7